MRLDFPVMLPGIHPPTAALARLLQVSQVENPLTGEPYSEAMLLGVGGGLDFNMILFRFKHLPNPLLIFGFRNHWNQTHIFLENITQKLALNVSFREFSSAAEAQSALQATIQQGKVAIVWVDRAMLPYQGLPDNMQGYFNHQAAVYGRDGRLWRLYVDDLSSGLIDIREKTFTEARASLSQNNFLMMVFNHAEELAGSHLRESITEGIRECAIQLNNPIQSQGISNLETWADKLVHRSDPTGWLQIFRDQTGLFPVMRSIYEAIKLFGSDGFALRKLYSDFLHETASYLGNPDLNAIAGQYLQLSNQWANLAENALPSKYAPFDRLKSLLNQQLKAYQQGDFDQHQQISADIDRLEEHIKGDYALERQELIAYFQRLASQIKLIAELERSAAHRLRDVSQL